MSDIKGHWEPMRHDHPDNDGPVWLDENGRLCWAGANGETQSLVLHGDMAVCQFVPDDEGTEDAFPPEVGKAMSKIAIYAATYGTDVYMYLVDPVVAKPIAVVQRWLTNYGYTFEGICVTDLHQMNPPKAPS